MDIRALLATDAPAIHESLLGDPEVAAWFRIVDGISEVEIGWTVARSHWRRGIASHLGRHALKLGMSYEKSFDFDDKPHVLYRKPLTES